MTKLSELRNAANDTLRRLRAGDVSVGVAQAEIRAIGMSVSVATLALEHARLSGRIEQGSDVIPDAVLGSSVAT